MGCSFSHSTSRLILERCVKRQNIWMTNAGMDLHFFLELMRDTSRLVSNREQLQKQNIKRMTEDIHCSLPAIGS